MTKFPPQRHRAGEPAVARSLGDVDYLTYCDFGAAFRRPDGTPNPALYRDGVHVNEAGYEILGAKIRERLLALTN